MDYCIVKNESKHIGFVVMVTIVIDIGVIHVSAHQTRQTLSCSHFKIKTNETHTKTMNKKYIV